MFVSKDSVSDEKQCGFKDKNILQNYDYKEVKWKIMGNIYTHDFSYIYMIFDIYITRTWRDPSLTEQKVYATKTQ